MRKGRLSRFFGILLAAGCADATFDLLPPPSEPGGEGAGGDEGTSGAPATGGSGALSGTGGAPDGGSARPGWDCDLEGDCRPPNCHPEDGCLPCLEDVNCQGTSKPFCGLSGRCMGCRPDTECPKFGACAYDCEMGERCDPFTSQCAPDCKYPQQCPEERLRRCDTQRLVCTECDPRRDSPLNKCPDGLHCTGVGSCEPCADGFDCSDYYRPICSFVTWECRACLSNEECNWGFPPGSQRVCDDDTGRCSDPGPPPPPPEP